MEEQFLYSLSKIGAPCGIFNAVYNDLMHGNIKFRHSPWNYVRYDFLIRHTFGYSIDEVDNMGEAEFEEFIKTKGQP